MSASAKGSACCADDEAKTCVEGVKLPELAVPFVPRTTLEISAELSDAALNYRGIRTCESRGRVSRMFVEHSFRMCPE